MPLPRVTHQVNPDEMDSFLFEEQEKSRKIHVAPKHRVDFWLAGAAGVGVGDEQLSAVHAGCLQPTAVLAHSS